MPRNRDEASILDIFNTGMEILDFVNGLELNDLKNDKKTLYAVLHGIQIIGEATKRLSKKFCEQHPNIPWKKMAGIRDRIVHEYDNVRLDIVWDVANQEIPELLEKITPLLPKKSRTQTQLNKINPQD